MAIGKWIPFTTQQSASTAQQAKTQQASVLGGANGKKFGLENVRPCFHLSNSSSHSPFSLGIPGGFASDLWVETDHRSCLHCSYANSVLQALYFCTPFRELVIQYADPSALLYIPQPSQPPLPPQHTPSAVRWKTERKPSAGHIAESIPPAVACIPSAPPTLFSALRSLFLFISKNPADKGTVAPRAFIEKLKEVNELFRSTMHQDAHEFLNYLLNKIVEEIEQERKRSAEDRESQALGRSQRD